MTLKGSSSSHIQLLCALGLYLARGCTGSSDTTGCTPGGVAHLTTDSTATTTVDHDLTYLAPRLPSREIAHTVCVPHTVHKGVRLRVPLHSSNNSNSGPSTDSAGISQLAIPAPYRQPALVLYCTSQQTTTVQLRGQITSALVTRRIGRQPHSLNGLVS